MSAMCQVPVEVVDELFGVECRASFLKVAVFALSELPEADFYAHGTSQAWRGLFYWTQDLEDMLRRLNEMTNPE